MFNVEETIYEFLHYYVTMRLWILDKSSQNNIILNQVVDPQIFCFQYNVHRLTPLVTVQHTEQFKTEIQL